MTEQNDNGERSRVTKAAVTEFIEQQEATLSPNHWELWPDSAKDRWNGLRALAGLGSLQQHDLIVRKLRNARTSLRMLETDEHAVDYDRLAAARREVIAWEQAVLDSEQRMNGQAPVDAAQA